MFIKELAVRNFRNYTKAFFEFSPGINLIAGPNAAGKTNILESISVIANLRSFRNISDHEIIKWGETSYHCSLILGGVSFEKFEIGCSVFSGNIQKKAKIDGIVKKKISDYYGKFLTVIFSPEDINLISGPPEARRKFIDGIISKTDAGYLDTLSDFKRILAARNKLLRDIREKRQGRSSELDVWDDMLAVRSSVILKKRIEFLKNYNSSFTDSGRRISGNEETPYIEYNASLSSFEENDILKKFHQTRDKDIITGFTGIGPHRDDFTLLYKKGILFKDCASQGQKRTAAVSLKIAEYRFIENQTKEKAVVLIDDIFGELDEKRKDRLMDVVKDGNQILITAVNPDSIGTDISDNILKYYISPDGLVKKL
ncbi:MAG: DNA replication/repair protein RecF [Spirochaetota bacterium]